MSQAIAGDPDIFYYVCDATDRLFSIDRTTGVKTDIGALNATAVEAIAYWPGTDILYGTDAGNFGTISTTTGAFSLISNVDANGCANGADGCLPLADIDGMSFDPWTGILWVSSRRNGDFDLLFQIDPNTGLFIEDAFGPGVDYIVIDGSGVFLDVDDIAISPVDGSMLTTSTQGGQAQLLEVNQSTGAVSIVATLQFSDVEGMSFNNSGTFWGTRGTTDDFYQILADGSMVGQVNLAPGCGDPEALAALVADASIITGSVWNDIDFDNNFEGGEIGVSSITLNLYYDTNANGINDSGDILIQTTQTATDGTYSFNFSALASLIIEVDQSSLPAGFALTGPNLETAVFTDNVNFGELDANNDFGIATSSDCDGDGIPDFVESAGDTDGDGVTDACDIDADNDGILDANEGNFDIDGDGIANFLDLDSDNDGIPDAIEVNSGIAPSGYSASSGSIEGTDSDGDGLLDIIDNDPTTQYGANSFSTLSLTDQDGDGIFDFFDLDADGDGLLDLVEAGGTDSNGDGKYDGFVDTNLDGYHDGLTSLPLPIPNTDLTYETTNGLAQLANYLDLDSDADGIVDRREGPTTLAYSEPTIVQDLDGDGIIDFFDTTYGGTPTTPTDTEGDGIPDYIDIDADNDGVVDEIEGNDADLNGTPDIPSSGVDANANGIDDAFEVCTAPINFASTDYAEENVGTGANNLTSSDLELSTDGTTVQEVGIYFPGVSLTQGQIISNAYIQFQTDEVSTGATSLSIFGQDIENASTFSGSGFDVSSRDKTAGEPWIPASWNVVGEADLAQRSPNIASIINTITNRSGWNSGNAMVLVITGTGRRTAETNPSLVIEIAGVGCDSNLPLQNQDNDQEPDFRDPKNTSNPGLFWLVCDGQDELRQVNRFTGAVNSVGPTGRLNIEAIAYWSGTNTLYAADAGELGTLNQTTGSFSSIGQIDGGGTASGSLGNISLNDVDGLSFDPWTGILWGSNRLAGNDVIFQIDETTGVFIPDAFGPGIDYIEVIGNGVYENVDDIAISPVDGQMYTVATLGTGEAQILNINKNTGVISLLANLDQADVEGMGYHNDGSFWGTVGTANLFIEIMLNGATNTVSDLGALGCTDPEAIASLVAPANEVCGIIWQDDDLSGTNNGESGLPNVTVQMYKDNNSNGVIDGPDELIQTVITNSLGEYQFFFAATGQLIIQVDDTTLPVGFGITTELTKVISFTDNVNFCEQSCGNDFGAIGGDDCDGDGIPDFQEGTADLDNDGISDACDLDSDNDGILDSVEGVLDTDGDGVADRNDLDSDNDGIPDAIEANGGTAPSGFSANTGRISGADADLDGLVDIVDSDPGAQYGSSISLLPHPDTDGDGIFDAYDLDADNDGILDIVEAGGTDADLNGTVDSFADSNNDGIHDALLTSPLPTYNSDLSYEQTNGLPIRPDYLDLDSDGDGIEDNREGQTTSGYTTPSLLVDNNNNGIIDFYDTALGGSPITPIDTDGDNSPDHRDLDSDGDTIQDATEANDANSDGIADSGPSGSDTDGDGIDNIFDNTPNGYGGTTTLPLQNFDGDVEPDWRDIDDDGDGINTESEPNDLDSSGVPDYLEISPCGPGFIQVGGGTTSGNADVIDNNAGVGNATEALDTPDGVGADFFQGGDRLDLDLTDVVPAGTTYSVIWRQRPGQGNQSRLQVFESTDGVTYNQHPNSFFQTNNETYFAENIVANQDVRYISLRSQNNRDLQVDAIVYSFSGVSCEQDSDLDGIVNSIDLDDDNDGIPDTVETFGIGPDASADGDAVPNYLDPDFLHPIYGSCTDSNGDGFCEVSVWDQDGDGVPNHLDLDADNDGLRDALEANNGVLPSNMNSNGQFDASYAAANDSDGDGLVDQVDTNAGGIALPTPNSDGDTVMLPDFLDLDSDGDGIVDAVEANDGVLPANMSTDGSYPAAYAQVNDTDGDGIVNDVDTNQGGTLLPNGDADGTGGPNYIDLDADGDGLSDAEEGFDPNIAPSNNDTDLDGVDDAYDPDQGGTPANLPDVDCNGVIDFLDPQIQTQGSGDWNTASTWSGGQVPANGSGVVVAPGHVVQVTGPITVGSLAIQSGGQVNNNGQTITLNGSLTVNGSLTGSGESVFAGTCAQSITGNVDFDNLTINNPNGVTLGSGSTVQISGILELADGALENCSGTMRLLSDATNTAMVNSQGNGSVTCDLTVERYVDGCEGWITLGSSVTGATLQEWNDDITTQGYTGSVAPTLPASIFWYDETVPGFNDQGYVAPTNASNSLVPGRGHFVYAFDAELPTTFDVTGALNTGSFTFPISYTVSSAGNDHDGFNLIANPYAATLDWYATRGWEKVSIQDVVYTWDRCLGQYACFVDGVSINGGTQYIAPGQGFWVKSFAPNTTLKVTDEATTFNNVSIFKTQSLERVLKVQVTNNSDQDLNDETAIRFVDGATTTQDHELDGEKFWTLVPNEPSIYTLDEETRRYGINALPLSATDISIPLGIGFEKAGDYTITFEESAAFPENTCIVLEDKLLGTMTPVSEETQLSISEATTQYYEDRWVLHFSLPPNASSTDLSCPGDSTGIASVLMEDKVNNKISWNGLDATTFEVSNLASGDYNYTIINDVTGCSHSGIVTIGLEHPVAARFTVDGDSILGGTPIEFENKSTGGQNYLWDFGDGTTSQEFEPLHIYKAVGVYEVTLTVSNDFCQKEFSKTVVVSDVLTGIDQPDFEQDLSIYPNPTRGQLRIAIGDRNYQSGTLEVISPLGTMILKQDELDLNLYTQDITLDLSGFDQGIYVVRVYLDEDVLVGRIVLVD